jgi:hypothetical protein
MGLVLIVVSLLVKTAVEVSTSHTRRQVTQKAAGNMSAVADDVQTYLERTYYEVRASLEAAPGGVIEESWDNLISSNRISLPALPVSPDGGDIRLLATARPDHPFRGPCDPEYAHPSERVGFQLEYPGDRDPYRPRP